MDSVVSEQQEQIVVVEMEVTLALATVSVCVCVCVRERVNLVGSPCPVLLSCGVKLHGGS